ncbi:Mediator of RNA polymerase II transcription subunit 6 [Cichlidogyrus casuarinus]|uniref:Mediator of RNA polymerase II transcription subunit 6 n=1 Tax=Cichlidogyrus casuarinus TaxID=1844966 RepID=A0ABD2QBN6_9PLAT
MTGVEYYLHHAQEPSLFIIRKQHRRSPGQVTPLAYYYVINGTVMQAPDLNRLCDARLQTASAGLNKALKVLSDWAHFNTTNGTYSWSSPSDDLKPPDPSEQLSKIKIEPSTASMYQLRRIDFLLSEWTKQYPNPSSIIQKSQSLLSQSQTAPRDQASQKPGEEPPSKKQKLD